MRWAAQISLAASVLALALSVLALAPPHRQRQWRHFVAGVLMWLWVKSTRVSRVMHDEFWSDGNGHDYGHNDLYGSER